MARDKRRTRARQPSMWVASTDLPRSAGHPCYQRLNHRLDDGGFLDEQCAKLDADGVGRPSLVPSRPSRRRRLDSVEGLDAERAITWRAADSRSLRLCLDVALGEAPPGHPTVSRTRRRVDVETPQAVFTWVWRLVSPSPALMPSDRPSPSWIGPVSTCYQLVVPFALHGRVSATDNS